MKVKWHSWKGRKVPFNDTYGITLEFLREISRRINKKLSTKITVVGEAGIGKTYLAIDFAMTFDPKFSIDQIIFSHEDYLNLTLKLPTGRFIVLDEPSYVISHREWYNDLNKILVRSIEADRYRVHPLVIPIINQTLLDKTVREHLIQYMIWVYDRGLARVYRVSHSQFQDKVYNNYKTDLYSIQPKIDLATCGRTTCLSCKELPDCNKFIWPQYERKRHATQTERWERGKTEIEQRERRKKSLRERVIDSIKNKPQLIDPITGEWNLTRLMLHHNISSNSSGYQLIKAIKLYESRNKG